MRSEVCSLASLVIVHVHTFLKHVFFYVLPNVLFKKGHRLCCENCYFILLAFPPQVFFFDTKKTRIKTERRTSHFHQAGPKNDANFKSSEFQEF